MQTLSYLLTLIWSPQVAFFYAQTEKAPGEPVLCHGGGMS